MREIERAERDDRPGRLDPVARGTRSHLLGAEDESFGDRPREREAGLAAELTRAQQAPADPPYEPPYPDGVLARKPGAVETNKPARRAWPRPPTSRSGRGRGGASEMLAGPGR